VVLFLATIGPVSCRFRIVRTSSPIAASRATPGITLRDEVDELAQFLAAWQRVTIERLSERVEQSEIIDKGLLAYVAKLLDAERIVISLLDPSGLRVWTVTLPWRSRLSQAIHRGHGQARAQSQGKRQQLRRRGSGSTLWRAAGTRQSGRR